MRKFLTISSIIFGGFLFAQNSEAKITLKQVQNEFKYKKYSTEVLKKFISEIDEIEQEPYVWEPVPGEIIGWNNDRASFSNQETFWIKNNKLTKIETQLSEKNLEKINKYAPRGKYFDFFEGYRSIGNVVKKLKNGQFLLVAELKLMDEKNIGNFEEGYTVEYLTKDFKNFIPLRISKEENKWTTIK